MADNVMIPDMLKSSRHYQNAQNLGILEASLFFGQVYRMVLCHLRSGTIAIQNLYILFVLSD